MRIGHTYFIQGSVLRIKIGFSDNPESRRHELQSHSPNWLRLVGYIENVPMTVESELHELFRRDRVRREWFAISFEMVRYLQALFGTDAPETTAPVVATELQHRIACRAMPILEAIEGKYTRHRPRLDEMEWLSNEMLL